MQPTNTPAILVIASGPSLSTDLQRAPRGATTAANAELEKLVREAKRVRGRLPEAARLAGLLPSLTSNLKALAAHHDAINAFKLSGDVEGCVCVLSYGWHKGDIISLQPSHRGHCKEQKLAKSVWTV